MNTHKAMTNHNPPRHHKGPWAHRVLVCGFSLLFGLLVYWVLGFVLRDIAAHKQRQSVLRDRTLNSERTMNQLLELQRLTLQKGLTGDRSSITREFQRRASRHQVSQAVLKLSLLGL
ncbi:MAG: hypothetical protein JXQ71_10630 [Verrucomicrobia bacterium]|nr:hypothetical protein [Verrucomicrobiota bacterium]